MTAMPDACTSCHRPMRRNSDHRPQSGTITYAGKGLCASCHGRNRRAANRPAECNSCGQGLHYRGGPRGEDTVEHVARGLCRTCYDADRNLAKTGEMYPDISREQHVHTLSGYNAWLADRRRRGVPTDGYQVADEPDTVAQLLARRGKTPSQRRAIGRLVEQLEAERAQVPAATARQERRHRAEYGIVA